MRAHLSLQYAIVQKTLALRILSLEIRNNSKIDQLHILKTLLNDGIQTSLVSLYEEWQKNDPSNSLSQNEARVLHSLIKWPDLTDQAVHSQIGMKKSTFSSIKTRLKENGYYTRYYVPNFPKIGLEMLVALHGHLNRFTSLEERMRVAKDLLESFVEDFHIASESNKAFNLSASTNLTEYSKNQEKFVQLYSENKFLDKNGMSVVYFPFEISRVRAFMDYESLVAKIFGFASDSYDKRQTIPNGQVTRAKLTKAEKKVLAGLVQFPEESDTLIADKVGVSRNTVANAKKKFLEQNICFPRAVPNLQKLGLKILVFSYRKFNPMTTMTQRAEASEMVRQLLAPFMYISKNLDGIVVSAHRSFEEYNQAHDEIMRFYLKHDYIIDEPISYQMSMNNINYIKEFDFLPLTLKTLGFESLSEFTDA